MNDTQQATAINDDSIAEYVSKKDFALIATCPVSSSELNWLFKQREINGFKQAFVKVTARNYLVHIPTFTNCLSEKRGL